MIAHIALAQVAIFLATLVVLLTAMMVGYEFNLLRDGLVKFFAIMIAPGALAMLLGLFLCRRLGLKPAAVWSVGLALSSTLLAWFATPYVVCYGFRACM